MSTISARLIASAVLAAFPLAAFAQTSSVYTPPKLIKQGTASAAVAGPGAVTVQVFVKKDGTFKVNRVIKSTNVADNAVALEIAKTATYKPALRDGVPVDGFYDYILNLGGAVSLEKPATASGPTAQAYALIRDGKYADAKATLTAYLQGHPGDPQASTLLGVANAFAGNDDEAAEAFDSVPTIPDQYHTLAVQAYTKHTSNLLDAQKYSDALASAGHVVALSPDSPNGYFFRGLANANQSQYATALPDLQKALELLKGMKPDDKTLANFEYWIAISQLNTGAYEAAAVTSKDVTRLDPLRGPSLAQDAFVVVSNAAIALVNAGKPAESVAQFEQGASIFPASAANFYGQAAFVLLGEKPPDFKKVKVEADKALALDPTNGRALFANAYVANNAGDQKGAIADINKAKASPLYGTDASFAKQVDDTSKKLNAAAS